MCGGCQYFSLPLIPAFGTQVFNSVAHSRRWTPKHFNQKYFNRRRQISITTKLQNTLYTSAWWTFVNTYHNMQSDRWKCSKSVHNMFIWHYHRLYAVKLSLWYDGVMTWIHAPHYRPFVRGIHHLPMDPLTKLQCFGALMLFFMLALTSCWIKSRSVGDLTLHGAHVMAL